MRDITSSRFSGCLEVKYSSIAMAFSPCQSKSPLSKKSLITPLLASCCKAARLSLLPWMPLQTSHSTLLKNPPPQFIGWLSLKNVRKPISMPSVSRIRVLGFYCKTKLKSIIPIGNSGFLEFYGVVMNWLRNAICVERYMSLLSILFCFLWHFSASLLKLPRIFFGLRLQPFHNHYAYSSHTFNL